MKVSQITTIELVKYLRIDDVDEEYDLLNSLLSAAKAYVRDETGLTDEEIDLHEDLSIAVMVIVSDLYDNRQTYVDKTNINKVVDSMLYRHKVNFL